MPASEAVVLPGSTIPSKYTLRLQPDLEAFVFQGEAAIDLEIKERISELVMNSLDIEIQSAKLEQGGKNIPVSGIAYNVDTESVTLALAEEAGEGSAKLSMEFTGILNDKLRGFYRSQYTTDSGETAYLATTQFEATDARQAFPCWDEPARKARFEVTLVVPEDMTALSNTPVVEETGGGARAEGGPVCGDADNVDLPAGLRGRAPFPH